MKLRLKLQVVEEVMKLKPRKRANQWNSVNCSAIAVTPSSDSNYKWMQLLMMESVSHFIYLLENLIVKFYESSYIYLPSKYKLLFSIYSNE